MNTNDFTFRPETPAEVEKVIRALYANKHRARFFYGDLETGTAWMEEYDVCGTVGKSTGSKPCALLINNARSMGGGSITSSIVRIIDTQTGRELYRHPTYNNPADRAFFQTPSDLPEYVANVLIDGEVHARFRNSTSAEHWIDFMQGKRFSK